MLERFGISLSMARAGARFQALSVVRSVAIAVFAVAVYILLAVFIFGGFYTLYDRYAETELTGFRAVFWAAFSLHAIATVAAAALVARLLQGSVLFAIVITVAVLAAFSWPLLEGASYWNGCFGVNDFPLDANPCG